MLSCVDHSSLRLDLHDNQEDDEGSSVHEQSEVVNQLRK